MGKVGVVSIQGDFEKHIEALKRCKVADPVQVRTPEDLATVERIILPGGESTTVGLLMERYGLGDAIQDAAAKGMPIWGTCMGMILMAKSVIGPKQYTLGLLDIEIERNAFGTQVHSFEDEVVLEGMKEPVLGVFIRAPIVTNIGGNVSILGKYDGKTVAVQSGKLVGTSFHPELTEDIRFHKWFLSL